MKRILICNLFLVFSSVCSNALVETDDPVKEERDALVARSAALKKIDSMAIEESIAYLGEGLRKMGDPSIYRLREETIPVYDATQQKLLSIPGHAEYFGERIREANEPLKGADYGRHVNKARNERMYGFGTLRHLPSPETVKVLGEMLSDTWRKQFNPPDDSMDVTMPPISLALAAVTSGFQHLPLRDPPSVPRLMARDDPEVVLVHPWQSWWKEIKSGKRAFAFKGQSLEYRFNPDGTWDTIPIANPPDDGPKPVPATVIDRPVKRTAPAQPGDPEASHDPSWRWYGIGGAALLVLGAWFWRRKRAGRSHPPL